MALVSTSYIGYPVSYDSENSSVDAVSNESNAYDADTSSNYAQFTTNAGWGAETIIFYDFNCSSIPVNATITSVECSVKCNHTSTWSSDVFTATSIQLYNGASTAKGSSTTFTATATSHSLTTGEWTRAELNNIKLRISGTRGIKNMTNTYYIRVYGATLTVNYTYNDEDLVTCMYIKNDGTWTQYNRVYKKINGTWVEQTMDDINTLSSTVIFIRGD